MSRYHTVQEIEQEKYDASESDENEDFIIDC